jgi:hypothetical protein
MSKTSVAKRRGTAAPRWGWSGDAPLITPEFTQAAVEKIRALLPPKISMKRILAELRGLGARYHRHLHQDEFGPPRAERMAALRELISQFQLVLSPLAELPLDLRLLLNNELVQLAPCGVVSNTDTDDFAAQNNDEEALQQLAEASLVYARMRADAVSGDKIEMMARLANAATGASACFAALDSTTAGTLIDGFPLPPLELDGNEPVVFNTVHARVRRLTGQLESALLRLERQHGPERALSLRLLVWDLCNLYERETGQRVTNSAVVDYAYTGEPQSTAGRFVLTCIEALRPTAASLMEPDHSAGQRIARALDKGTLKRRVYFAIREFVANRSDQAVEELAQSVQ